MQKFSAKYKKIILCGVFSVLVLALGAFLFLFVTHSIQAKKEADLNNALAIFQRTAPQNLKWSEENGSYKVSQADLFAPYTASFSLGGITFQRGDSAIPLKLNFPSQNTPQKMEKRGDRIIYYFSDFVVVYSPIEKELKNDVIFFKKPKSDFSLSWQIDSSDTLEAKQGADGEIGIYGSEKFWQDSVKSNDPALLQEIQAKSEKTKLLYTVKAPYIIEANGSVHKDLCSYEMKNNVLSLKLNGDLPNLAYPISIDPSVSYSPETVFNASTASANGAILRLDSTHFVAVYSAAKGGTAVIGTLSGSTISYAAEYLFAPGGYLPNVSLSLLDPTHFVVVYSESVGYHSGASIGTISGNVITFGSEYVFSSNYFIFPSVSALDSTHFVVTYDSGFSRVGTISGSTITYGSEYASATGFVFALDSTRFVIISESSSGGTAVVGTVSGSTITFGSSYSFESSYIFRESAALIDSTRFVVAYSTTGAYNGTALIGTVSGNTITYGSKYIFNNGFTQGTISVSPLSSTSIVVSYTDNGNSSYGTSAVGTISGGNVITFGSEYVFNAAASAAISVSYLDATHFAVLYADSGNSGLGTDIVGTVSGTAVVYGSEYTINSGVVNSVSVARLDATHFVVAYKDSGRYNYGIAIIGTLSGASTTYGSEYVFNAGDTFSTSVYSLDSANFVVAYTDVGNSNYGTAVIGTVSGGNVISFGLEYVFSSTTVNEPSVAPLDSTHFVVVYNENYGSGYGTAIIGAVSGGTIAYGSKYVFNPAATGNTNVSSLSSTRFVVAYRDSTSGNGTAIIGTVSGTTISFGSQYVYNNTGGYISVYNDVVALDSTHFVVAFKDGGNSGYGTAMIGTVSGSAITYGSKYVFNPADNYYVTVSSLSSSQFVVSYHDCSPGYGRAIVGTVSGSDISYYTEGTFNTGAVEYVSVAALDSTHFAIGYRDSSNANQGASVIGTVVPYDSAYVFNPASTGYVSIARIDSTHFVAAYSDAGNSYYGTAVIGTVSGSTVTYGSEYVFYQLRNDYSYVSVSLLDSTHFVVAYVNSSILGAAVIGTVSGSAISFGSEYLFNPASTCYVSVSTLDSTHFVIAYNDNWTTGSAIIGAVSGNVISYGSEYVFNATNTNYISVSYLDSAHFVIAYQYPSNEDGVAVAGTISSGNVISYGSPNVFNAGVFGTYSWNGAAHMSVASIDPSHFVIAYVDWGSPSKAIVGTVSSGNITYGLEYPFSSSTAYEISTSMLDSTHFAIAYEDFGNSSWGTTIVGAISGTSISFEPSYVFSPNSSTNPSVASLDATHFVVGYKDISGYGAAVIGTLAEESAVACADHNMAGWAWSENVGWISFSCKNIGTAVNDYGIDMNEETGLISGYAWSEYAGWISFNSSDLSGCPSGTCEAGMSLTTYAVSGWAKALAAGDGWDGWIRLSGTASDSSPYGVSLNNLAKEFTGWAWGDTNMGWISFNCANRSSCGTSNYKVTTTLSFASPPTITNLISPDQISANYCSCYFDGETLREDGNNSSPFVIWRYDDPGSYPLKSYQLRVSATNDVNAASPVIDVLAEGRNESSGTDVSFPVPVKISPSAGQLAYNTTYYWWVKACNQADACTSDWVAGPSFSTPSKHYPMVKLAWDKLALMINEDVQFCSTANVSDPEDPCYPVCWKGTGSPVVSPDGSDWACSVCFDSFNNYQACQDTSATYNWYFPGTEGTDYSFQASTTVSSPNPQIRFLTPEKDRIFKLKVTGSDCGGSATGDVVLPLPVWKEQTPF